MPQTPASPDKPLSPLDVAQAFTQAWTRRDLAAAAEFVAEDVVFDGPLQQSTGKQPYMNGLTRLSSEITGMMPIAAFGDADKALLMYDLSTAHHGVLTCAKCLTVDAQGRIIRDRLVFDSHRMRQATHTAHEVQAPPASQSPALVS